MKNRGDIHDVLVENIYTYGICIVGVFAIDPIQNFLYDVGFKDLPHPYKIGALQFLAIVFFVTMLWTTLRRWNIYKDISQ